MSAALSFLDVGLLTGLIYSLPVVALALAFRVLAFPDLTIEGSFSLAAATFGIIVKGGGSPTVGAAAGILAGAAAGGLTALLHARFKINKLLAGIIVVAICYTVSLRAMGAPNIGLISAPSAFTLVAFLDRDGTHLGSILLLVAIVSVIVTLCSQGLASRVGLRLRAAGANPGYARLLGVNVPANLICGLALSNAIAATGGILSAMSQGFADAGMGQGLLIMALAALAIGERTLPVRLNYSGFVLGAALLGTLIYQVVVCFAIQTGISAVDLKLATAILVLLVIATRASRRGPAFLEGIE
ncbi:ABC transporter permease [Opitutus terrae]|uniref:Inner-membrane translocator n=1 Tax=Opitutus terrae (strain DSM 11246 / JCM 15787 / PB90-1) TaxID=452637 RepID=B1ZRJ3_OPITP|nr:inner-membrane translocator [Opitutus terrae]ACB77643.1 inner-membrane translocator [Opitutus terrae PB90-1]